MTDQSVLEYIQSLRKSEHLGAQVAAYRYEPGLAARWQSLAEELPADLAAILSQMGIDKLYSHQHDAINAVRQGLHVVVNTPTASGKSLIYNLPAYENFCRDPMSGALYIFPLKALTQDQFKGLQTWNSGKSGKGMTAAVYDGDTSAYQRRKIRNQLPNVILTNPEMLHLAFLPHHAKWEAFFRRLKLVVIDEVHTYRGLLGCHMAQVLRRLLRICRYYDAHPTFVCASATIGNPDDLARNLTGLPVRAIENSGSPQGDRHLVLMDPLDGPAQTAILLLKAAMARKLRTIVYTQSRKMAELITIWVQQRAGQFKDQISVYRAGLLPEERRRIESDLKNGKLLAVVSTSALELGIDIGDLDLCILVGYPGSIMAVRQRGGRVGRKGQDAAVITLAGQDALDQYFVSHPEAFFGGEPERAVVNPYNAVVLAAHLACAAAELPIGCDEPWIVEAPVAAAVASLEAEGTLLTSADGKTRHALDQRIHRKVDLRSAGDRFQLYHGDQLMGEVNGFRLYRETHVGALYLHQGQTYLVRDVDESVKSVFMEPVHVDYHTRARTDTDVEILEIYERNNRGNTVICNGRVKVTDHVTGFVRIHTRTGRTLDHTELDVPPAVFTTESIWFEIDPRICTDTMAEGYDLLGTLHAAEHAAIGMLPLIILADRNDLGGLATAYHPQTRKAVIFIYDGIPGGAGLSRQAFSRTDRLFSSVIEVITGCGCEKGCPACIHSPKCGSGNHPVDKGGALGLFQKIRAAAASAVGKADPVVLSGIRSKPTGVVRDVRFGVFDLETQRSAQEVGGWHRAHLMKVSCGVIYDSQTDTYEVYMADQVDLLIDHLKQFDLVVGFNSKRFDYKVLSGYSAFDFMSLPSFDLLERVHALLGFRLSLDHLAEQTLGLKKDGSGLDALKWWQEGNLQKLVAYCKKDVRITLDLYRFLVKNRYLIFRQKSGDRFRIPINLR